MQSSRRPVVPPRSPTRVIRAPAPAPTAPRGPPVPKYAQPGERVIVRTGRHPYSILDVILGLGILAAMLAAAVVAIVVLGLAPPVSTILYMVIAVLAMLLVVAAVAARWRISTSDYLLTSERVYKSYGKLRYFLLQTTYDKVTDVHVHQSLFGRWKGFGNVMVQTAGAGITLEGVRDPFGILHALESARVEFVRTLIGEQRPTRQAFATSPGVPPLATETGAVARSVLWVGRPSWAAFWVQLVPLALFFGVFVLGSGVAGFVQGDPRLAVLLTLALIVFFGLVVAAMLVRQRTSRYEVHTTGVVITVGWLSRRRVETTFEKVTDVTTTQGVVGRIFAYGSISINTAGSNTAPVVFQNVPDPDVVKATIDAARSRRRLG